MSISFLFAAVVLLRLHHESKALNERAAERVLLSEEGDELLAAHVAHAEQELLHLREKLRAACDALKTRLDGGQHRRRRAFGREDAVPRIDRKIDALLAESRYLRIKVDPLLGCDAEHLQLAGVHERF